MQLTLSILYSTALWACHVSAIPLPQSGTGADSCDSEPLTEDTWISLNIDQFLTDWTPNVTQAETNNVQALADSFGSPNFFCGIDQFCNAGQPCLPVKLPAWYALMGYHRSNPGGIYEQLEGGRFLGSAQNFTQSELQAKMIDSFKTYSIGLALQAQKIFIARFSGVNPEEDSCKDAEQASNLCQDDENGVYTRYVLVKVDGKGNMDPQIDIADKIINKYGFSKEKVLVEPTKCFDKNGGKQVMDDFGDFIPIEPNTLCLYNVAVCDGSKLDECRENGANV
ncbi:hypothetical protein FOQG_19165 [Fusarium oxysporum f. sp. raphani 54005]|uniref:DUF7872 domain-containing protein n=2 Tax=Fusarium oxysporum f. sp. raphani TaxID=96318 RepID=X0BZV8_FUSOX|nr:hypothetical protein FOQG_19165 [Fusarium oxysporum f. sp. raphani 54005]KAG7408004.1 hypothetical protein Forpi1262_v018129 [Fusarium oxysporum f. sp. raphani]